MFKENFFIFLLIAFLVAGAGCTQKGSKQKLRIAIAANVEFALEEIREAFQEETGIQIEFSPGSSGKLTAQIQNGAPFHLFLSADMKYPEDLVKSGHAVGDVKVYANGTLVVWSLSNKIPIDQWYKHLESAAIKKIVIPNPDIAPYGRAAFRCLHKKGLFPQVQSKVILGTSITQVNQFVLSGGSEIGFTSKSAVLAPKVQGKGVWAEVATDCYDSIKQGMVLLKKGMREQKENSLKFFNYLSSDQAKAILQKYGYRME